MSRKRLWVILAALMIVKTLVLVNLDSHTYWTFDEPWNTDSGLQILREHQFRRTKDSFTPIQVINVWVGEELRQVWPGMDRLTSFRVASIALSAPAVPLAYVFATMLGAEAWLALLFTVLVNFEPNLLGHSVIAGVDGYVYTTFMALAVAAFYWLRRRDWKSLVLFGGVLGLAQGVKFTAAYAVPVCLIWLIYVSRKQNKKSIAKSLALFLLAALIGLDSAYVFNKVGTAFNQIPFVTQRFQHLGRLLGSLPTPFPVDYLQGLDMSMNTDTIPRPVYIMGHRFMHGVWYYFVYDLLLKFPLPLLVAGFGGWYALWRKKKIQAEHGLMIACFVFIFFYFSLLSKGQVGVRLLFPIIPFLMAGILWFPWSKKSLGVLAAWMAFTMAYNWPNMIGYFNELVIKKENRWWHLADSNLTWNQEWKDWPAFVNDHEHMSWDKVGNPGLSLNEDFYEDAITVAGFLSPYALKPLKENFWPVSSFRGTELKYHITNAEIAEAFPVEHLNVPPLAGGEPVPPDCAFPGWEDERGLTVPSLDIVKDAPRGSHDYRARFTLQSPARLFFQLASKNGAAAALNGMPLLVNEEPTPRLSVRSVELMPGTYEAWVHYQKDWDDGHILFKAFDLDNPQPGQNFVRFCLPHQPQR